MDDLDALLQLLLNPRLDREYWIVIFRTEDEGALSYHFCFSLEAVRSCQPPQPWKLLIAHIPGSLPLAARSEGVREQVPVGAI